MGTKIESSDDLGSAMLGLAAGSGMVISQRLAQILTGRLSMAECLRMSAEKQFAFAEAMTLAGVATLRGDFPHAVWADAMMPYRRAVSANAERLGEIVEALPDGVTPPRPAIAARLDGPDRVR